MKYKNHQGGFIPVLIIVVVAAAAAIGGGVYYANQKAEVETDAQATTTVDTSMNSNTGATTSASMDADINATASLRSLLALGGSQKCTVSATTADGGTSGVVYVSGGKMRGDFQSEISGSGKIESHMIIDGEQAYVWSGSQGAKMDVDAMTGTSASAQASAQGQVDLDQDVSYDCERATVSASQFNAPSSVNFIDVSAMIQGQIQIPAY